MAEHTQIKLPSVAVIIPTHNRWPMLAEAIDSVLKQSYANVTCVVVDDASTDKTTAELQKRYGDQITVLANKTNIEKSASRNRGFHEVEADFVCFLDSDDLLAKDSLSSRMQIFIDDPSFTGIAFGSTSREKLSESNPNQRDITQKDRVQLDLLFYLDNKEAIHTSGFLIRRSTLLAEGGFCEGLTNREDIELFIRLLVKYEFRYCGAAVSILRTHGDDRARSNWDKIIRQGRSMSISLEKALEANTSESIKKILQTVKQEECEELLRALYRKKFYSEFLALYKQLEPDNLAPKNIQWLKRKFLAFLKSPFSSKISDSSKKTSADKIRH